MTLGQTNSTFTEIVFLTGGSVLTSPVTNASTSKYGSTWIAPAYSTGTLNGVTDY
jgi:hypothetical protein